MTQTRDRRIFLAWKGAKRRQDYRSGHGPNALEFVARKFRLPVRHVRDIVEDQKRDNARRTRA